MRFCLYPNVARRPAPGLGIQSAARASGRHDVLARLGGDEFAVLLDDAGRDTAVAVAKTLCAALDEAFALDDVTVHNGVSIGIALFPTTAQTGAPCCAKADVAMCKAKASRSGHHVYRRGGDGADVARLQSAELGGALSTDQRLRPFEPHRPEALRPPPRSQRSPSSS